MSVADDLKLFGLHNLLLEAELRKVEDSGIQIEHAKTIQKGEIVDVELFESDILQQAQRMADFYAIYYSLENSIRRLIPGRLSPPSRPGEKNKTQRLPWNSHYDWYRKRGQVSRSSTRLEMLWLTAASLMTTRSSDSNCSGRTGFVSKARLVFRVIQADAPA